MRLKKLVMEYIKNLDNIEKYKDCNDDYLQSELKNLKLANKLLLLRIRIKVKI